jgi:hypothetical protein
MELYDAPDVFRRELKNQTIRVERPALTILAASATSWLAEQLKGGDMRSGFLNRFCFVLADRKTKSYPIPQTPEIGLKNRLVKDLHQVGEITGSADLARVQHSYAAWYRDVEREAQRCQDRIEEVSAFYTRLSVTALKVAVLLELAQTRNLTVTESTMQEALVLVDYLRAVIRYLLRVEFAPTEGAKRVQRILKAVVGRPGIKKGELLRTTGYETRELTPLVQTLIERGDIYEADGGYWAG